MSIISLQIGSKAPWFIVVSSQMNPFIIEVSWKKMLCKYLIIRIMYYVCIIYYEYT